MSKSRVSNVATYVAIFVLGSLTTAGVFLAVNPASAGDPIALEGEQINPNTTISQPMVSEDDSNLAPVTTETENIESEAESSSEVVKASDRTITQISDLRRGSRATIEGVVERVTDEDEFVIADSSGSIQVWTGNEFFTVESGDRIVVSGFIDDDLLKEVYAERIYLEDGSVIEISQRY
jgi:uncharacterized protein YdeI (BOF family)